MAVWTASVLSRNAGPGSAGSLAESVVARQFQQLADANEVLQQELSRCYERLNVVLEISETSSAFDDPGMIEATLLSRYSSALNTAALLLDRLDHCAQVRLEHSDDSSLIVAPGQVRARLAGDIEAVRRTRRVCRLDRAEAARRGLGAYHAMLSALQDDTAQPHVVIALRRGEQPAFDDADQLASETVLVYGGHILRNARMVRRLQHVSLETVGALANAIEARDKYTGGHSERVGWLTVMTGMALDLPASQLQMLEWSGLLHDVGKIGIPEHILNKPGELTPAEFEQIKRHPRLGYDVLHPVSSLKPVLDAVLYHHENYDGSGYPEGQRGEEIPLLARILHVADIFDALTSTRAYRRGLGVEQALDLLAEGAGRITDPAVTAAFVDAFSHYLRTQPEEFARRFPHLAEAAAAGSGHEAALRE